MSRLNKVNKGQFTQRGRLTPDEAARERMKQQETPARGRADEPTGKRPPVHGARDASRPRSAPEE